MGAEADRLGFVGLALDAQLSGGFSDAGVADGMRLAAVPSSRGGRETKLVKLCQRSASSAGSTRAVSLHFAAGQEVKMDHRTFGVALDEQPLAAGREFAVCPRANGTSPDWEHAQS